MVHSMAKNAEMFSCVLGAFVVKKQKLHIYQGSGDSLDIASQPGSNFSETLTYPRCSFIDSCELHYETWNHRPAAVR